MATPKSLPARPSLESLRKQAKKLTRDVTAGDRDAISRMRAQLPGAEPPLSLRDAQLSRWTKVLLQITEPEVGRQHACFAPCFRGRQHEHP